MTCRICLDEGDLIQPCDCTGTTAYVHEECLLKWLAVSDRKDCEICKFEYEIVEVIEKKKVCCKSKLFSNTPDTSAAVILIGLFGLFIIMFSTTYWGTDAETIFIYGNLFQIIMLILLYPHINIREVAFFWKCCSSGCLLLSSIVSNEWDFFYCEILFTAILGLHVIAHLKMYEKQSIRYINIVDRSTNVETVQGP